MPQDPRYPTPSPDDQAIPPPPAARMAPRRPDREPWRGIAEDVDLEVVIVSLHVATGAAVGALTGSRSAGLGVVRERRRAARSCWATFEVAGGGWCARPRKPVGCELASRPMTGFYNRGAEAPRQAWLRRSRGALHRKTGQTGTR
jgi:hypothetical protein